MAIECSPRAFRRRSKTSNARARLSFACSLAAVSLLTSAAQGAPSEDGLPASERGIFQHYFAALWLGKGLRFNNPYRLPTPLGDDYESVSASATYVGVGAGATFGAPAGLQHGAALQFDYALDGIRQEVLTPSYVVLHGFSARLLGYARFGTPVVLEPDLNLGLELGAGGVWYVRAGLGICAELIGSMFYGAATLEHSVTYVPMLSLQLGLRADYEVLP
jgi:hypothetical protein